jgi:hypothetical protein
MLGISLKTLYNRLREYDTRKEMHTGSSTAAGSPDAVMAE